MSYVCMLDESAVTDSINATHQIYIFELFMYLSAANFSYNSKDFHFLRMHTGKVDF